MKIKDIRIFLPEIVISDKNLSPLDRLLLGIVIALDNRNGCFATNLTLANLVNCTTASVSNSIKKLIELDYIVKNENINGRGFKRVVSRNLKLHKSSI